jgi:deazaflavin-dependent oxidoreductase (nitroreductase family)
MAYLKPPWFTAKVFNKIAMATGVSGTERLTLTARASGAQQEIPVITVDVDGTRYLVSTRGESQWVRNVRANPTVTLTTKVGAARFTAAEIPVAQRDPVLTAYRAKAGKTVDGYFAKLPDPADHPVFSLTPV